MVLHIDYVYRLEFLITGDRNTFWWTYRKGNLLKTMSKKVENQAWKYGQEAIPLQGLESRNFRTGLEGMLLLLPGEKNANPFTHRTSHTQKSKSQQSTSTGCANVTAHLLATGGRKGITRVFEAQAAGISIPVRLYTMVLVCSPEGNQDSGVKNGGRCWVAIKWQMVLYDKSMREFWNGKIWIK